ncbi:hypothetical protein L249_2680 [Ophiocordyceps polyrhachis-furcata BCC 54312]|uniref:Methyltransferase type 11 domain-containing protein n=1 Tax=Ophiocordyceps polyrhachis-furcata BCC 54312 TaxID=1330021 RepID=A0A367LNY8_9HYPO|nr:hypothetical protein L249_2680 [Ophiocordyceps polyrhachis-furcata BCC 54312]
MTTLLQKNAATSMTIPFLARCQRRLASKQASPPPRYKPAFKPKRPSPNINPRQQQQQPTQAETVLTLWRRSWMPLTGASLVAGFFGFYLVSTIVATSSSPLAKPSLDDDDDDDETTKPTGRPPALTGENAVRFDRELDFSEWFMGISSLRAALARRAAGHVLEVAVGGGRNLKFYDWRPLGKAPSEVAEDGGGGGGGGGGIISFTGLDINVDMLDVARRRLVEAVPPMASLAPVVKASSMADNTGGLLSFLADRVRLVQGDVHGRLPSPPPFASASCYYYDTVIQTFGLCSVSNPVSVLTNLASVVRPGSGRIILLEHGRGWFGLINGLLDRYAGGHCAKFGCWWNRDMDAIVRQAVSQTPGLELVKLERPNVWQFGTLVWVELRVAPAPEGGNSSIV